MISWKIRKSWAAMGVYIVSLGIIICLTHLSQMGNHRKGAIMLETDLISKSKMGKEWVKVSVSIPFLLNHLYIFYSQFRSTAAERVLWLYTILHLSSSHLWRTTYKTLRCVAIQPCSQDSSVSACTLNTVCILESKIDEWESKIGIVEDILLSIKKAK